MMLIREMLENLRVGGSGIIKVLFAPSRAPFVDDDNVPPTLFNSSFLISICELVFAWSSMLRLKREWKFAFENNSTADFFSRKHISISAENILSNDWQWLNKLKWDSWAAEKNIKIFFWNLKLDLTVLTENNQILRCQFFTLNDVI